MGLNSTMNKVELLYLKNKSYTEYIIIKQGNSVYDRYVKTPRIK